MYLQCDSNENAKMFGSSKNLSCSVTATLLNPTNTTPSVVKPDDRDAQSPSFSVEQTLCCEMVRLAVVSECLFIQQSSVFERVDALRHGLHVDLRERRPQNRERDTCHLQRQPLHLPRKRLDPCGGFIGPFFSTLPSNTWTNETPCAFALSCPLNPCVFASCSAKCRPSDSNPAVIALSDASTPPSLLSTPSCSFCPLLLLTHSVNPFLSSARPP